MQLLFLAMSTAQKMLCLAYELTLNELEQSCKSNSSKNTRQDILRIGLQNRNAQTNEKRPLFRRYAVHVLSTNDSETLTKWLSQFIMKMHFALWKWVRECSLNVGLATECKTNCMVQLYCTLHTIVHYT